MEKPTPTKGRPTKLTDELADRLCEEIAIGRSVNKICKESWSPDQTTFYRWVYRNEEFRQKYTRARTLAQELAADTIWDLAESATVETVNVDRLKVDTAKWIASKLLPKKYGDKSQIDHTNSDGSLRPTVIELVAPDV
jgi:hypothetical protein